MAEPETAAQPPETAPVVEPPEAAPAPEAAPSANAEAAKYRKRLREAEAALEAAQARVGAMQRSEIETYAAKQLAVGADLFEIGKVALADLLHENGETDLHAVDAAVSELLKERPGLRSGNAPWGEVGGGSAEMPERAPNMHDALNFRG